MIQHSSGAGFASLRLGLPPTQPTVLDAGTGTSNRSPARTLPTRFRIDGRFFLEAGEQQLLTRHQKRPLCSPISLAARRGLSQDRPIHYNSKPPSPSPPPSISHPPSFASRNTAPLPLARPIVTCMLFVSHPTHGNSGAWDMTLYLSCSSAA